VGDQKEPFGGGEAHGDPDTWLHGNELSAEP